MNIESYSGFGASLKPAYWLVVITLCIVGGITILLSIFIEQVHAFNIFSNACPWWCRGIGLLICGSTFIFLAKRWEKSFRGYRHEGIQDETILWFSVFSSVFVALMAVNGIMGIVQIIKALYF